MSTKITVRKSLSDEQLAAYVTNQVNAFFPDGHSVPIEAARSVMKTTLERLEHCFAHVNNKYFFDGEAAVFNHLHGDQYAMFLYLLSNTAHKAGIADLAGKAFLLNKSLHGIDAFYETELPSIFLFVHPLATVLGRGVYADYFLVYQRCGIGSNHDVYPELEKFVTLRPGSAVLGRCRVGENSAIATESLLLDRDLPNNSLYIGNPRDFTVRGDNPKASVWRAPKG